MTRTQQTRRALYTRAGVWLRRQMLCRGLRRGLRDERGSSLIEVTLITFFFGMPLLFGTGEMSCVVYDSLEISSAAHAGAIYGMQSTTYASNTSGITTAAKLDAADFASALSVTPTVFWVCATNPTGTQYTGTNAQTNAEAACTGSGNHALEFITVATSATVTPQIHCVGLPSTFTLHGSSTMEVEQ